MDKLQSVKLKDKSEGSEFSMAEQMADTRRAAKFQKNKTTSFRSNMTTDRWRHRH